MKHLVKHLLHTNRSEIVAKSLINCHVKGLHSIMLSEGAGKTIRIYITTPDHQLHDNYINPESLAFHPHHCKLTLHCVYGQLANIIMKVENAVIGNNCKEYNRWIYTSNISTGKEMGFVKDGSDILRLEARKVLTVGTSQLMNASSIHTVACPKNTVNAWFVYEGAENKNYKPYAWSNNDLSNIDNNGLYQKMDISQIEQLLHCVNLLPCN